MFLETAEAVSLFQTQPACLHKKGNWPDRDTWLQKAVLLKYIPDRLHEVLNQSGMYLRAFRFPEQGIRKELVINGVEALDFS